MKSLEEINNECIARNKEISKRNRRMSRDMFIGKIKRKFKKFWRM